ncbi:AAA family ATPase [Nesterenkonia halobia]|uniref:AAA domain-containing protein n=1 Tax=Nesterenkonia halobia TaxID=37922 RepID=A0ABP6RJG2_9MICC
MSEPSTDALAGSFNAEWLLCQQFPPIEYAVPGIVPEGLTLLVAPPKIGKSWMVLDFAVTAAVGGRALHAVDVRHRPVLYLALEDGPRRLQNRLHALGAGIGSPDLTFMTDVVNAHETIREYLQRNDGKHPLVIVDTLGKIKGVYNGNDSYGADYEHTASLKGLVDMHPGSALLVVHHTRKGQSADFVDSVSGTQGIAGAADTILTLQRERNDGSATLNVTSRDASEGQYAVSFADGRWSLEGSTLAEAAQAVQQREATEGVGDDMSTIVSVVHQHPDGIKRADLIEESGLPAQRVDTYLNRAVKAGRVARSGRGTYTPVRSERSESFADSDDGNLTHLSQLTGGTGDPTPPQEQVWSSPLNLEHQRRAAS